MRYFTILSFPDAEIHSVAPRSSLMNCRPGDADIDAAVVGVRDVDVTCLIEIAVMGAALMVRAEIGHQPQGLRVEHRDTIFVDVRRELDVLRIAEHSIAHPQKLNTNRIARDGRQSKRQQKGDEENGEKFLAWRVSPAFRFAYDRCYDTASARPIKLLVTT